jgi:hypothetical protein
LVACAARSLGVYGHCLYESGTCAGSGKSFRKIAPALLTPGKEGLKCAVRLARQARGGHEFFHRKVLTATETGL